MPVTRRLFLPPAQIAAARDQRVLLTAEQARYLNLVLRLRENDELEVFDGRGTRWRALLERPGADATVLHLAATLPASGGTPLHEGTAGGSPLRIVLAQALIKSEKFELVVQKATELGVARILPMATERSVVKLDEQRGAQKRERWQRIAEEAARQCGRAEVPEVAAPCGWGALFALLGGEPGWRGVLLDPEEKSLRLSAAAQGAAALLIAVGPEGGFSPEEHLRALGAGMLAAGLGPLVLRTETAGLAALAVLQHQAGHLG